MKVLINISNHGSEKWSASQKNGWDKIVDIPFPNVPADLKDVTPIVQDLFEKIVKIFEEWREADVYIMLQGEFSVCYLLFYKVQVIMTGRVRFVVPTTERKVIETVTDEGVVEKRSIFEFVQWRVVQ